MRSHVINEIELWRGLEVWGKKKQSNLVTESSKSLDLNEDFAPSRRVPCHAVSDKPPQTRIFQL